MGAIDIKLYAMNAGTFVLSMTNIEPALKIILLLSYYWLYHTQMARASKQKEK